VSPLLRPLRRTTSPIGLGPASRQIRPNGNRDNGCVRFVVADEGLGVPDDDRERIFDRFTRLDPGMSRGIAGTGLGLFLVRSMVEGMHGNVWCEPNSPRGSKFVFELPARDVADCCSSTTGVTPYLSHTTKPAPATTSRHGSAKLTVRASAPARTATLTATRPPRTNAQTSSGASSGM